jgi:hypothetical protein
LKYIIWYGDETTYRDTDGPPELAPKRNIQVISQEDPDTGQSFVRSNDFYWWTTEGWQGGDFFGLYDYLIDPGTKIILFGRTVGNRQFQKILQRALNDGSGYLPPKSAWHEGERRP